MQVRDIIRTIAKVLWTVIKSIFVLILDILYYVFLDCDENDLKDDSRESYYWEDHNMY